MFSSPRKQKSTRSSDSARSDRMKFSDDEILHEVKR